MATRLVQEFCRFCRESKRLRQLLRDTRRCFRDINSVRGDDGKKACTAQLSESENAEIESNVNKVPCLIVLGQTCAAKVHVVNQIFQKTVLPLPDERNGEPPRWRTVCFRYGTTPSLCLSLPGSFELVNDLMIKGDAWKTISAQNLELRKSDDPDLADGIATLEVKIRHSLLKDGGMVAVASSGEGIGGAWEVFGRISENRVPVVIYALARNTLSEQDLSFLRELQEFYPDINVFFVKVPDCSPSRSQCNSSPPQGSPSRSQCNSSGPQCSPSRSQCNPSRSQCNCRHGHDHNFHSTNGVIIDDEANCTDASNSNLNNSHIIFDAHPTDSNDIDVECVEDKTQSHDATSLDVFQQLLRLGFLSALPLSPPPPSSKLAQTLTESGGSCRAPDSELVEDFDQFPDAVATFTHQVLERHLLRVTNLLHLVHMRTLETFILAAFDMSRDILVTPRKLEFAREREAELYESLMQMALLKQDEIQGMIGATISGMREELLTKATSYDFIGVDIAESGCPSCASDLKICTAEIQELILGSLNRAIAGKLLGSVDVLRDSYTGVLTRCLRSLEESDQETTEAIRTTEALKEILNSAYQVEITVRAGASLARVLLEKMKQLMHSMPWRTSPLIDSEWKRKVVADMLDSLRETRLAKSICAQIKDHLHRSHDTFSTALKQLDARHSGRLERTEEQRLQLRKCYAPRVARLVLESTSLRDSILFGMPELGREIGRGQYGVVYSCNSWAGCEPCAVKTVVPPDDRHWNDLALEFYYTKNVPEHERIVALRGAITDTTFSLASPAVLLVMDRLQRDLYVAIKTGLDWLSRLQVAIDVVEGIRYLHSLGLVHRDIKLKNVLLDKQNRGKITDLGFCKPEAMMSGSIVGTPIHMAPELFSKRYDGSVDVYAFGILFWYVCAGRTQLPYAFEQCQDKEMLWTSVKRGIRPERLQHFQPDCWQLMVESWDGNPTKRPLLGNVEVKLRSIHRRNRDEAGTRGRHRRLSLGPLPCEAEESSTDLDSI